MVGKFARTETSRKARSRRVSHCTRTSLSLRQAGGEPLWLSLLCDLPANGAGWVAGISRFQLSAVASVDSGAGGGVRRRPRNGGQTAEIIGLYAA